MNGGALRILLFIFLVLVTLSLLVFVKPNFSRPGENIKPDLSEDRTIQEDEETISIDFSSCTQDKRTIWLPMDSVIVEVRRKDNGNCIMNYGSEAEQAKWSKSLPWNCSVPTDQGEMEFVKTNVDINFESIQEYCTNE